METKLRGCFPVKYWPDWECFWGFSCPQPGLQEVANTNVRELLTSLGLSVPEHMDKLILSVSDGGSHLNYNAIRALCGLIYGKGTLLDTTTKTKQVRLL